MSTINVTNLSGRGGATPNLPDGANITGVATATTFSGTLDGSLKSTGTPTLGLGVTINSSGLHISGVTTVGVVTGGTYYGSGSNLTGVGESIAPWHYNPDINDIDVTVGTGIGVTFNKKVLAGSGTATLKIVNAGTAGTTIQSWGVSSCTFNVTEFTMGSLVSDLIINQTYQVDIPSGFIVDSNETSYAGTAYTFTAQGAARYLFAWGLNDKGQLGLNNTTPVSSPVQLTGGDWERFYGASSVDLDSGKFKVQAKMGGELFAWGDNSNGNLALNDTAGRSSPTQIPGTTWTNKVNNSYGQAGAIKSDGTLYMWGYNYYGSLGNNTAGNPSSISSPTQIPGTTWSTISSQKTTAAVKTDGTLWTWGRNEEGQGGSNNVVTYSSPIQIPGTTWRNCLASSDSQHTMATKTDGTLWVWGTNTQGQLGQNSQVKYSSPVQVPGTNWSEGLMNNTYTSIASKTDGTLWAWGLNNYGVLGQNSQVKYSSPVQIPGTTWSTNWYGYASSYRSMKALKTDGTLWSWGINEFGQLGVNDRASRSSPIQVGSDTDWESISSSAYASFGTKQDTTP